MALVKPSMAKVSSLVHATEDNDKVVQAVLNVCPPGASSKLLTIRAKGHYGNPIQTIQLTFSGGKRAEKLFTHLWENLSAQDKRQVYDNLERHLDGSGSLHVRVGKQSAMKRIISLDEYEPIKVEILFGGWDRTEPRADQIRAMLANMR